MAASYKSDSLVHMRVGGGVYEWAIVPKTIYFLIFQAATTKIRTRSLLFLFLKKKSILFIYLLFH